MDWDDEEKTESQRGCGSVLERSARGRRTGRGRGRGAGFEEQGVGRNGANVGRNEVRRCEEAPKNILPEGSPEEVVLTGKGPIIDLYDNCSEPVGPTFYAAGMTPFEIFRHFFNDDVVEIILRESIRYAKQVKNVSFI